MKRLTEAWFEFNGIRSDDMGILIRQMPIRYSPGRNYSHKKVAGKNGTIVLGDGSYNDVNVRIECDVHDGTRIPEILAWLTGSGDLRFSDEPGYAYTASIEKEFSRASIIPRMAGQRFTVAWVCEPFRKHYPEPESITIAENGTVLDNPGTAPAEPRITIAGSGGFSLTIGMETMYFSGVEGGIIVDTVLMDAFTADGALLANDHVDGEFFHIAPGFNVVSWLADEGSSVESVTITPRWRSL